MTKTKYLRALAMLILPCFLLVSLSSPLVLADALSTNDHAEGEEPHPVTPAPSAAHGPGACSSGEDQDVNPPAGGSVDQPDSGKQGFQAGLVSPEGLQPEVTQAEELQSDPAPAESESCPDHNRAPASKEPGVEWEDSLDYKGQKTETGDTPDRESEDVENKLEINGSEKIGPEKAGVLTANDGNKEKESSSRALEHTGNQLQFNAPGADLQEAGSFVKIETPEDLDKIRDNLSGHFKLMADISLSGNWSPIGSSETGNQFSGMFDGQNHTISGLLINNGSMPADKYVGLFGYASGATIKNLNLDGVTVYGDEYVGGLVGYARGTVISNCSVSGTVTGTGNFVGGLAGSLSSILSVSSQISASSVHCHVTGKLGVGGLAGYVGPTCSIDNSYASGEVTGENYAGGLTGQLAKDSSLMNSYSAVNVNEGAPTAKDIGNLAGLTHPTAAINSSSNYWYSAEGGQVESPAGLSLDAGQMRQQGNFAGWCFEQIWVMEDSLGYPVLAWQVPDPEPGVTPEPDPGLNPGPVPGLKPGCGGSFILSREPVPLSGLALKISHVLNNHLKTAQELIGAMLEGTEEVTAENLELVKMELAKVELILVLYRDYVPVTERELILEQIAVIMEAVGSLEKSRLAQPAAVNYGRGIVPA